jgi:hypothetical protein
MEPKGIEIERLFTVLLVSASDRNYEVLYSLSGTHYGRVIPIFRVAGELESFKAYAQTSLSPNYEIKTMLIVADDLNQIYAELTKRNLIPSGASRVALEGTDFFDEVIAELITGTIWTQETA